MRGPRTRWKVLWIVCLLRSTRAPRAPHSRTFPQWTQRPCRLSCAVHCTGLFDKVAARHLREHGDHLLSPHDPAEPAGAAGDVVDLPFAVKVLTALRLLLLAEDAREALAAAVRETRRQGWAAAAGRGGGVGSRRRRGADIFRVTCASARRHGVDCRPGVCTRERRSARARGSA